ncbi:hypothetical protein ANRL3_01164 [Anaerolineae bacterium]|nr:hypothetical protein ANRL3_01164 [Anaerolineae bacterium]
MANDETAIEKMVLTRLMHLNALIIGLISGFVLGGAIFLVTIFLVLKGGPNVGMHLILLDNFFPGYAVTVTGSFLGFLYGFLTGFVLGYVVGNLYNWFAGIRSSTTTKPKD